MLKTYVGKTRTVWISLRYDWDCLELICGRLGTLCETRVRWKVPEVHLNETTTIRPVLPRTNPGKMGGLIGTV